MAVSMIGPKFYAWDRNGKPLAFGKLYTYKARTNEPKPTYQSEDQVVENTNPVILNGEGYANVYLSGSYKMVLKDDKDNEIWSSDPVSSSQQVNEWAGCKSASYVAPNKFLVTGNYVDEYIINRRVRLSDNTPNFSYASVVESVYANGETIVTLKESFVSTSVDQVCSSVVTNESIGIENYTDIVFKVSGGNSAVENMVNDLALNPLMYAVGTIMKTGGTTWEYKDATGPITIDNFRAFNACYAGDFDITGNGDESVKLQKAIDATKGLLLIPEIAITAKNVTVKDNLTIEGLSPSSTLNLIGVDDEDCIIKDTGKSSLSKVTFRNLALTGNATYLQANAYNAVWLGSTGSDRTVTRIKFERVYFSGFSRAARLTNATDFDFEECEFEKCYQTAPSNTRGYAILLSNCGDGRINKNTFKDTVMRHATYVGTGCDGIDITYNTYYVNSDDAFRPTGYEHPAKFLNSTRCSFKWNKVYKGYQTVLFEGVVDDVAIEENDFFDTMGICTYTSSTTVDNLSVNLNRGTLKKSTADTSFAIRLGGTNAITFSMIGNNLKSEEVLVFCSGADSELNLTANILERTDLAGQENDHCVSPTPTSVVINSIGNTYKNWDVPLRYGVITTSGDKATGCTSLFGMIYGASSIGKSSVEGLTPDKVIRSDTAILPGWSGTTFTNRGATSARDHQLPAATLGLTYKFILAGSDNMELLVQGGERFREATNGQKLQLVNVGTSVEIMCSEAGVWDVVSSRGTINYLNS